MADHNWITPSIAYEKVAAHETTKHSRRYSSFPR